MAENKVIISDGATSWAQVVRNKAGEVVTERTVPLASDVYRSAEDFGNFCAELGGDRLTSVSKALDELRAQSSELATKVDEAKVETEVEKYGSQLNSVVELYKSLEEYYDENFSRRLPMAGD